MFDCFVSWLVSDMNVIAEITRINEEELKYGIHGGKEGSWHSKYKDSAWCYLGGLSTELSEGDVICFMSQWGEVEDVNLVRDKKSNKPLGYCFVKYEDQRSTILAVDNFNGIPLLKRKLRCDHVENYRLPKEILEKETQAIEDNPDYEINIQPGHAYVGKEAENNEFSIAEGQDLWGNKRKHEGDDKKHRKDEKKHRKAEKKKKHKHHHKSSSEKKDDKKIGNNNHQVLSEQKMSDNVQGVKNGKDDNEASAPVNSKRSTEERASTYSKGFHSSRMDDSMNSAAHSWRGRMNPSKSNLKY